MKRITVLLLAMALVVGSVATAKADGIDIKVKGQWDFAFGVVNNAVFKKSYNDSQRDGRFVTGKQRRDNDNFEARQRIRTQINFISSEYLQAVLMFEIGDLDWGRNTNGTVGRSSGGALDADGVNVETKRAYLDWIIPNTEVSVRMGIQGLKLPSTRMGNMVFDADVAAIVVSAPITDWLGLTAFWARPFDSFQNDADGNSNNFGWQQDNLNDEVDMFGVVVPLTFDGFSLTPYVVYARIGNASDFWSYSFDRDLGGYSWIKNSATNAWWFGGNFTLDMFNPLTFSLDYIYGRIAKTEFGYPGRPWLKAHLNDLSASGWYIGATLDYKLDWGTPGIFGWYASGDKKNARDSNHIGRLPVLGTDGGFTATSFGTAGYYGIGNAGNAAVISNTGTGTWGVGLQVADVSFIEDLSHTLRVAYYRGTNDADLVRRNRSNNKTRGGAEFRPYSSDALYLTDDDSVIEVNFDHVYKIYENLEVCLELGYLHLRSDKGTWGWSNTDNNLKKNDDAWKAEFNFRYSF